MTCFAKKSSVLFVSRCMLQTIGDANNTEISFFEIFFSFVFPDGWGYCGQSEINVYVEIKAFF